MWNLKEKQKQMNKQKIPETDQTGSCQRGGAGGMGKIGEGHQELQTSNYKINKSQG